MGRGGWVPLKMVIFGDKSWRCLSTAASSTPYTHWNLQVVIVPAWVRPGCRAAREMSMASWKRRECEAGAWEAGGRQLLPDHPGPAPRADYSQWPWEVTGQVYPEICPVASSTPCSRVLYQMGMAVLRPASLAGEVTGWAEFSTFPSRCWGWSPVLAVGRLRALGQGLRDRQTRAVHL